MTSIIKVQNLSKQYFLGAHKRKRETFREMLAGRLKAPFRLLRHGLPPQKEKTRFWALKDISFEVKQGEVTGILGRNGSGKSTLLKILSRITDPTQGRAEIHGRVASLLEVGTGFHPELSGRENIYLNGIILGMRKREIDRQFDQIVAFSEVEKFIDTPVKRYSSGMGVRLAFAIGAHLRPEILLVDEVLAVGDVEFQKKCLGKMGDVAKTGRTVLFVSHNMAALAAVCETALLLDSGKLMYRGSIHEAIDKYLENMQSSNTAEMFFNQPGLPDASIKFRYAAVLDGKGNPHQNHSMSSPLQIALEYEVAKPVKSAEIICHIRNFQNVHVLSTADIDGTPELLHSRQPGIYRALITVPAGLLAPGFYKLGLTAGIPNQTVIGNLEGPAFEISAMGSAAAHWSAGRKDVVVGLPLEWTLNQINK